MKAILIYILLTLLSPILFAQNIDSIKKTFDTVRISQSHPAKTFVVSDPDPPIHDPNRRTDKYGDLLNDDPTYNIRSDYIVPVYKVLLQQVELWAIDRYVLNYDFARIGFN